MATRQLPRRRRHLVVTEGLGNAFRCRARCRGGWSVPRTSCSQPRKRFNKGKTEKLKTSKPNTPQMQRADVRLLRRGERGGSMAAPEVSWPCLTSDWSQPAGPAQFGFPDGLDSLLIAGLQVQTSFRSTSTELTTPNSMKANNNREKVVGSCQVSHSSRGIRRRPIWTLQC